MEEWKLIKGFDGRFSISNEGRIKQNEITYTSLQNKKIHHEEKILEPYLWQSRYLRIDLISQRKGKKYRLNTYIHKLVAEYFIGPRPEGCQIDHIDGNYLNNKVENLRYCSVKENRNNPITYKRNKESMKTFWENMSNERRKEIGQIIKESLSKPDVKIKMSKSHKNLIPVYKGNDYKRIKPEELENYINKGYKKGLPEYVINKCKENTNYAHMYGETNPAYGRKWMTNGIDKVFLKPEEFTKYLELGYVFGQKMKNCDRHI